MASRNDVISLLDTGLSTTEVSLKLKTSKRWVEIIAGAKVQTAGTGKKDRTHHWGGPPMIWSAARRTEVYEPPVRHQPKPFTRATVKTKRVLEPA
jgi:hypothetical protein